MLSAADLEGEVGDGADRAVASAEPGYAQHRRSFRNRRPARRDGRCIRRACRWRAARPKFITVTWSQNSFTRRTLCSTISTVRPPSRRLCTRSPISFDSCTFIPAVGSSSSKQPRAGAERAGDLDPPLLAVRQGFREHIGLIAQLHALEQLARMVLDRLVRRARLRQAEERRPQRRAAPDVAAGHHLLEHRHAAEQAHVLIGASDALRGDVVGRASAGSRRRRSGSCRCPTAASR